MLSYGNRNEEGTDMSTFNNKISLQEVLTRVKTHIDEIGDFKGSEHADLIANYIQQVFQDSSVQQNNWKATGSNNFYVGHDGSSLPLMTIQSEIKQCEPFPALEVQPHQTEAAHILQQAAQQVLQEQLSTPSTTVEEVTGVGANIATVGQQTQI